MNTFVLIGETSAGMQKARSVGGSYETLVEAELAAAEWIKQSNSRISVCIAEIRVIVSRRVELDRIELST